MNGIHEVTGSIPVWSTILTSLTLVRLGSLPFALLTRLRGAPPCRLELEPPEHGEVAKPEDRDQNDHDHERQQHGERNVVPASP